MVEVQRLTRELLGAVLTREIVTQVNSIARETNSHVRQTVVDLKHQDGRDLDHPVGRRDGCIPILSTEFRPRREVVHLMFLVQRLGCSSAEQTHCALQVSDPDGSPLLVEDENLSGHDVPLP